MSNIDKSPSVKREAVPQKPKQDVQSLLNILREASAEIQAEDPCLLMAGFFEHMPMPAWIKAFQDDGTFIMIHVNRAYAALTGIRAIDYLAQSDEAHWSATDAGVFEHEDLMCVLERRTVPICGTVPLQHEPDRAVSFTGFKWPIMKAGEVVAVCGFCQTGEVVDVRA